ncbi:MAG TPA: DUF6688 family protein [Polyangia bacterium]|nr:DUF6688 family protein [Polyangia bacterium]
MAETRAQRAATIGLVLGLALAWALTVSGLCERLSGRHPVESGNLGWYHPLVLAAALLVLGVVNRRLGRRGLYAAAEWLALVGLPLWGLFIDRALPTCLEDACGAIWRPLAVPQIYGIYALHGLAALAYLVSRRRPEALRPGTELALSSLLLAGAALDAIVAIHFLPLQTSFMMLPRAALVFPLIGLPLLAPSLSALLLARAAVLRLQQRGAEELARRAPSSLPRVLAGAPVVLGLYALAHALVTSDPFGAAQAFTHACLGTFARLHPPPADCHYLCTVAAQGHSWLVRPLRLGRRRGAPILVNRQLAIANAFEDLLHERWPRFGRFARRAYDRLGLPVSRFIRRRALADAVYLAMKPAEWIFYLALLLLDRRPPEQRIDRMYR